MSKILFQRNGTTESKVNFSLYSSSDLIEYSMRLYNSKSGIFFSSLTVFLPILLSRLVCVRHWICVECGSSNQLLFCFSFFLFQRNSRTKNRTLIILHSFAFFSLPNSFFNLFWKKLEKEEVFGSYWNEKPRDSKE